MTIAALGSPTTELPPIRKIKSSSIVDLHDAIRYLTLVYNPEIRGSHILDRRNCALRAGSRPVSPQSPRRRMDNLASSVVDLSAVRNDPYERAYAVRWLTSLVSQAMFLEDNSEETEAVVQDAASLLALCAGPASAGARSRTFVFATTVSHDQESQDLRVQITDLPLDNQDYSSVGAQTWGGACLLADLIVQSPHTFGLPSPASTDKPLRILELGAGTGLVSLTAGKLTSSRTITAEIVTTDFHPAVLENLNKNVAANFPPSPSSAHVSISSCFLDWSKPPGPQTPPFDRAFDVMYGADIIYELDHALWIKNCVEKFLRKPSLDSLESVTSLFGPAMHPCFHLVIPLRATHTAEARTIEHVFPLAPSVRAGWDAPSSGVSDVQDYTLAITAKEVILCEDVVWSNDRREVEYVHYTISWV
jgi:predicted nicotinamide N-methyase